MPYPPKPTLTYDYEQFEAGLGDGEFPGAELDADLANLQLAISDVIDFVKSIAKSDGTLANQSVGAEQLKASVLVGLDTPTIWATSTAYTTTSLVFNGTKLYLAAAAHTSGASFAADLSAGLWNEIIDLTPTGALIAANNLSDLSDANAARANLGLGTLATTAAGTGADQVRTNGQNETVFLRAGQNLSDLVSAAVARTNLGLGTMALETAALYGTTADNDGRYARRANNLSDLSNAGAARTNLGLGSLATLNSGTGAGDVRTNAQAETAYTPNGPWPGVYTGTSSANVTFPVGSYILSSEGSVPRSKVPSDVNPAHVLRLSDVSDENYVVTGSGAALTGTWRARGDGKFFQRVA